MKKIGLIDVDGGNYPNLALMKISSWHKKQGDFVEWYDPMFSGHMDKVYMSKVFSFSPDYLYPIDADEIEKGGSGYCISLDENGKEYFDQSKNKELPYEIEHSFPDYSIYYDLIPETKQTAYGFLTRGCPRGCDFCIVGKKEGRCSIKVADLNEFWNGQKYIELLDPNLFACRDWKHLAQQLIDSKAYVNFNQGVDIRIMTKEMAETIGKIKLKTIHFAFDRYEQKDLVIPRLELFKEYSGVPLYKTMVYVLTNFNTTFEQDVWRVKKLWEMGYYPYVMIYEKYNLPKNHMLFKLQRWCNNRFVFKRCTWEEYVERMAKNGKL